MDLKNILPCGQSPDNDYYGVHTRSQRAKFLSQQTADAATAEAATAEAATAEATAPGIAAPAAPAPGIYYDDGGYHDHDHDHDPEVIALRALRLVEFQQRFLFLVSTADAATAEAMTAAAATWPEFAE